jgi:hypothetical protein
MKFRILLLVYLMWILPAHAYAAGAISIVGVSDTSSISATGKTVGSQTAFGGGLLIGLPLAMRLSIETGALYFNRNWTDTTTGSNTLSSQVLEVPVLLKFHLRFLSIGAGGYYSSNIGSLNETGTVNNSSLGFGQYGINPYDYGLIGDVGVHIPLGRGFLLRVDGQYLYGLVNIATAPANTVQYRDFQVLAGFTFIFGDRTK